MKAYKIDLSGFTGKVREVVSEAAQKKAFALGYHWSSNCKEPLELKAENLIFGEKGYIAYTPSYHFEEMAESPITAADFLALESAQEFEPFQKVLVRNTDQQAWNADLFSHMSNDEPGIYITVSAARKQCIPYEGNEHLLGKKE